MIGTKFYKPLQKDVLVSYVEKTVVDETGKEKSTKQPIFSQNDAPNTLSKYAEAANWCNETGGATIEDKGDYYEVVAIPAPSLDRAREQKLAALDTAFLAWYDDGATVTSSLGFVADSDSRAIMDISGLVTSLEAQPVESRAAVAFMDAENQPHQLTLDQLKTLQLEVIKNGQYAYEQKWAFRTQIEAAQTTEELEAIEIEFKGLTL